jgi:hypothetical protein
MNKNRPETKKSWQALYQAARAEYQAREDYYRAEYFNGVLSPREIMDFALQNADQTYGWDADTKAYWQVAFGSIYESAEANGVTEAVQPFFKANKWVF